MGRKLDLTLAILNGTIGQFLQSTGNGLSTRMELMQRGSPVPLTQGGLARAYPDASRRAVLLVHGIMCTEAVWEFPDGTDYGTLLAQDSDLTPLYLRYNSGVAIADNGAALARLLETLVECYPGPLDEILLLGFSMGGLVIRSACHFAHEEGLPWLGLVRRAVYIGTPHLGAPLERAGQLVTQLLRGIDDPYTQIVGDIANLRSDGLKDLGHADLRRADRDRKKLNGELGDPEHPVPLLPNIEHYLVAGSLSTDPMLGALFGDALVPVASATAGHCRDRASIALPPAHVKILKGVSHTALAHHPEVYAHLRAWSQAAT